jgi:soluble lytic murein transglycosylase
MHSTIRHIAWALALFLALCPLSSSAVPVGGEGGYDAIICRHAADNHIPPQLVKAVIWRESRFDAAAVGAAGEIGLMQVSAAAMADWAAAGGRAAPEKSALFDPDFNLMVGCWYLSRAMGYWGGYKSHAMPLALCEYNAGRSGMLRYVGLDDDGALVICDPHLHGYVASIIQRCAEYAALPPVSAPQTASLTR